MLCVFLIDYYLVFDCYYGDIGGGVGFSVGREMFYVRSNLCIQFDIGMLIFGVYVDGYWVFVDN